jgi:hypothetical protein
MHTTCGSCPQANFNAIHNPGCSGVIITPDGVLHLFGGDVGSGVRSLGDGRQYVHVGRGRGREGLPAWRRGARVAGPGYLRQPWQPCDP